MHSVLFLPSHVYAFTAACAEGVDMQRTSFILDRMGMSSCPSTLSDLALALSRFTCTPGPGPTSDTSIHVSTRCREGCVMQTPPRGELFQVSPVFTLAINSGNGVG